MPLLANSAGATNSWKTSTGRGTAVSKAIVLLRVSSSGQTRRAGSDEGYSVEVQRRGCFEKARQLEGLLKPKLFDANPHRRA